MERFLITAEDSITKARTGVLRTAHGDIPTPCFMPIGTVGAVKHVMPAELRAAGADIMLSNTYHLALRPGTEFLAQRGGLHRFMGWDGPILTDSGGFQVFSLGARERPLAFARGKRGGTNLVQIDEDGVTFRSHIDGSSHRFTPESVIEHQRNIGSDIAMVLDVCPPQPCPREVLRAAVERTTRWAARSIVHRARIINSRGEKVTYSMYTCTQNMSHENRMVEVPGAGGVGSVGGVGSAGGENEGSERGIRSLLFGIVQGGSDEQIRRESVAGITACDFDGYAIGGVAVGEDKEAIRAAIELTAPLLPTDKPRYLMGLGTPDDIVHAVAQGVDMFDCVLPTRDGRHGRVYARIPNTQYPISKSDQPFYERFDLTAAAQRENDSPIDSTCTCVACATFSRAYLRHLFAIGEPLGQRLATIHNLTFYLTMMREIRESIGRMVQ